MKPKATKNKAVKKKENRLLRESLPKKILLFGFDAIPDILAVASVGQTFGAETLSVSPEEYNHPLSALTGLRSGASPSPKIDEIQSVKNWHGGGLGEKMLVFCGLRQELDSILAVLQKAGFGHCLKAVLTAQNQNWNPVQLYQTLSQERQRMDYKNKK